MGVGGGDCFFWLTLRTNVLKNCRCPQFQLQSQGFWVFVTAIVAALVAFRHGCLCVLVSGCVFYGLIWGWCLFLLAHILNQGFQKQTPTAKLRFLGVCDCNCGCTYAFVRNFLWYQLTWWNCYSDCDLELCLESAVLCQCWWWIYSYQFIWSLGSSLYHMLERNVSATFVLTFRCNFWLKRCKLMVLMLIAHYYFQVA